MMITKDMSAEEKMARCNEITRSQVVPVLERYLERRLLRSEIEAVEFHINMLFMESCPFVEMLLHDFNFGKAMAARTN